MFSFPERAYDSNVTVSAAAPAGSAHCHLVCLTPQVFTTTWQDFQEGYIYTEPIKLVVRWEAKALFSLAEGTAGSVEVVIEYSANGGGSWTLLERFFRNSPPSAQLPAHDVSATLDQNQDVSLVKVRATLT